MRASRLKLSNQAFFYDSKFAISEKKIDYIVISISMPFRGPCIRSGEDHSLSVTKLENLI